MAGTYYNKLGAIEAFIQRVRDAGAATGADDLLDRLEELLPVYGQGLIVSLRPSDVRAILVEDLPGPAEDDSFGDLLDRLTDLIEETGEVL
jgi:hypothetical protein